MSDDLRASTTDAARIQAHRASIERQGQADLRELETRQRDTIERASAQYAEMNEKTKSAYEVQISQEAERLEETLSKQRIVHDQRIADEKRAQDAEFAKLRDHHQKRVAEYKKRSEQELEQVRKDLQSSTERLHEQARKTQRKNSAPEV